MIHSTAANMQPYLSTSGVLAVQGFNLKYVIEGDGPPALVMGSAIYYPRTFSPALRRSMRLIFADHRGFGEPTGPYTDADFEIDVLIADFEALRRSLQIEQLIVIGHSGHAHLALAYAKKYPAHVSHVVLIANSPDSTLQSFSAADRYLEESFSPERKRLLARMTKHYAAQIAADPDRRFIYYALGSGPRIWYDPTFDAHPMWEGVRLVPEMFDYVWGMLFATIDITEGLDTFDKPVFLALGRYDYWNPPHLWERVRPYFHDLRIRVFERSGHTPQFEEPELFDEALITWLIDKGAPLTLAYPIGAED